MRSTATAMLVGLVACSKAPSRELPPPEGEPPVVGAAAVLTRIREDFDNFELVDQATGVIHDVNRGLVRLPTRQFPVIDEAPRMTFEAEAEVDGVITGDDIVLDDTARLRATDSVVLEARHTLHITGQIHVGPGGITLAAGRSITIQGVVESEGPIQIFLGDPEGLIDVQGKVAALGTPTKDGSSLPGVVISARGHVEIKGTVMSSSSGPATSGDVTVDAYGPVRIAAEAVVATPSNGGKSGVIHLRSERSVELAPQGLLGNDPTHFPARTAGDLDVEAPEVVLGEGARILGSGSQQGRGASVQLAASERLELGKDASVVGGSGVQGGSVTIHAKVLDLREHASVIGGLGLESAGRVLIQASSMITLEPNAEIAGGEGACADGGDADILVAGTLILGAGARIRGGDGGTGGALEGCVVQSRRGGSTDVTTRAFAGDADGISAGSGARPGETHLTADPGVRVLQPDLTVSTQGVIESKLIDRGEDAVGQVPILREVQMLEAPAGTAIHIQLAGALAPGDAVGEFVEGSTIAADAFSALSGARFFRYRVLLEGRAFDTPVLDFFDIDLAPASPAH